jgi:hypothetical protein
VLISGFNCSLRSVAKSLKGSPYCPRMITDCSPRHWACWSLRTFIYQPRLKYSAVLATASLRYTREGHFGRCSIKIWFLSGVGKIGFRASSGTVTSLARGSPSSLLPGHRRAGSASGGSGTKIPSPPGRRDRPSMVNHIWACCHVYGVHLLFNPSIVIRVFKRRDLPTFSGGQSCGGSHSTPFVNHRPFYHILLTRSRVESGSRPDCVSPGLWDMIESNWPCIRSGAPWSILIWIPSIVRCSQERDRKLSHWGL